MKQMYLFIATFLCLGLGISAQSPYVLHIMGKNAAEGQALKTNTLTTTGTGWLEPKPAYNAEDIITEHTGFYAIAPFNTLLYAVDKDTIRCFDLNDNYNEIKKIPKPSGYDSWPSFLSVSPDGKYLWAGFTVNGNTDDRIYKVNIETGDWEQKAVMACNFDLEFWNDKLLVSGLNSSSWSSPNSIWLLDTLGTNNHKKIIEIGGNSAGLAIDNEGNIYCGNYSYTGDPTALYRWNSSDIEPIINGTETDSLVISDGTKLTDFGGNGLYDCDIDDAGNLIFNDNSNASKSILAKWNGIEGDGLNFDTIALASGISDWLTMVETTGDITNYKDGNALFALGYSKPIGKITHKHPFISEVLEYKPGPGQFINTKPWGLPTTAPPSLAGTVTGSMSLGAFGGYVVFKFENPVENDADNPFGVDFTVFGNPLGSYTGEVIWSEPGVVYVMKDENGNGEPDDTWYELAGSDYFFSTTIKNYEVTYTNPQQNVAADVPWTDNLGNSGNVEANGFHHQPYYPLPENFPDVDNNSYTLTGTKVKDDVDRTNPSYIKSYAKAFGYVDNRLRGNKPWTVPDNPYTYEKENSGGDAFDISWAVDAEGNYVDLDKIHFVKVQNAVLAQAGWLGEVSTEVTGAVDVAPDASVTGIRDMVVINRLPLEITVSSFQLEVAAFCNGRYDPDKEIVWQVSNTDASIDENNVLHVDESCNGDLTVTASFADNSNISASMETTINVTTTGIALNENEKELIIAPNPASGFITINTDKAESIKIYDIAGSLKTEIRNYSAGNRIDISNLKQGIYLVKVRYNNRYETLRFIKR